QVIGGGLEQEFNSLHAQREAGEAYIRSRRHEGWRLVKIQYDDGRYSGGALECPAVKSLLIDLQARRVQVLVVYKLRPPEPLAQRLRPADAQRAPVLCPILECEVTGECIRYKIAAKNQIMRMDGMPPCRLRSEKTESWWSIASSRKLSGTIHIECDGARI